MSKTKLPQRRFRYATPQEDKNCTVCGETSKARGLCQKHYDRWRKWGDPVEKKAPAPFKFVE